MSIQQADAPNPIHLCIYLSIFNCSICTLKQLVKIDMMFKKTAAAAATTTY